jgi:geranylgeranyl diphosphate synthase type I
MTDPLAASRGPVDGILDAFLTQACVRLTALDPALGPVAQAAADLVRGGGKRLRPAFVYWGCVAAGGEPDDAALRAAGAVELLHAFALVHDDVMDRSDERRGRPAVHRAMGAWHAGEGLRGDADWFGVGAAILAGDLLFVWADELFDQAIDQLADGRAARAVFTDLRVEVMAGQYLDLRLAGLYAPTREQVLRVALLKSGRYTVTRPLLLGAAVSRSPRDASLEEALHAYGDALGVAFQLRDDVLGLFGDPAVTGKGAIGDLREGKRTLLVLRALELAGPAGRAAIEAGLGDAGLDEAAAGRIREVVRGCGALAAVEREVQERLAEAHAAVRRLPEPARGALERLALDAASRGA